MTAKVIAEAVVELKSDLTGKVATETRSFTMDGKTPTLHLTEQEAAKFDELLGKYIRKAHTVEIDPAALRSWARENGVAVGERGRISVEVRNAYLGITPDADEPQAEVTPEPAADAPVDAPSAE